jgi:hypothetical protein
MRSLFRLALPLISHFGEGRGSRRHGVGASQKREDWIIFALVSVGAAAAGFGIVIAASRIEQRRRARHTELFGDH